jgi:pyridoxal phosphate enzyme (YggS family)
VNIEANIQNIYQQIQTVCHRLGRNPAEVKLLLVTKTVSAETIKEALDVGVNLIGENKIQEALAKYQILKNENIEWHFIGHLQTNKIKDVLKFAHMIQSVDRLDLVQKLSARLQLENKIMPILIQVNTSREASKFGVAPEDALSLIPEAAKYPNLQIKGLMTIGANSEDEAKVRESFRLLKKIQQQVIHAQIEGVSMEILSMGMSGDFEMALEEGANLVRIGSAIFGER